MIKKWITAGLLSFGMFSAFLMANRGDEVVLLRELANVENLAFGETLPDVEIVCGSFENKGRCWDGECLTQWTPFGWYAAWECDKSTGNTSDFCSDGVPC